MIEIEPIDRRLTAQRQEHSPVTEMADEDILFHPDRYSSDIYLQALLRVEEKVIGIPMKPKNRAIQLQEGVLQREGVVKLGHGRYTLSP